MSMILLYMVAALAADPDALEPRIASYGGALAIDLDGRGKDRGVEVGRRRYVIEDCSAEADLCLEGYVVRLSIPRECPEFFVGQEFELGNEVLAIGSTSDYPSVSRGHYVSEFALIGSEDRPWVVYAYDFHAGLIGVYVDYFERADIVGLVNADGVNGVLDPEGYGGPGFLDLKLETVRGLMACR